MSEVVKTSKTKVTLPLFIEKQKEGTYFTVPFIMPNGIKSITLRYNYQEYVRGEEPGEIGEFTGRTKINTIDLGLIAPDGSQVGASGSDKAEFTLSETSATPGYHPHPLTPGEWQIIVGAYRIADEGVQVTYEIEFTPKTRRLFKGDLHVHTVASDGVQTVADLAQRARRHGLDFLAITDHNQPVSADSLPRIDGITLIPGLEWTHYQGHAGFLGTERPYDGSFIANTPDEVKAHFISAHERGATIIVDHPFDENCPFLFDINSLPIDAIEVWNGPMRESNLKAVGFWQTLLAAGKRIPISGGSDFHRDTPFLFPGGPTTCVYAMSNSPADILAAVREGHSYITFAPDAPSLEMSANGSIIGDTVSLASTRSIHIKLENLSGGDVVRIVDRKEAKAILQAPRHGEFELDYPVSAPGITRVEVVRTFLPGLPLLPALLSNPIYFE
jgi:hypothetical protein